MLELVIGIPLTIAAWKRGWKGWALLPLALVLLVSFVVGYIIGYSAQPGSTLEDIEGIMNVAGWAIDLTAFGALVAMILFPRRNRRDNELVTTPNIRGKGAFCSSCGKEEQGTPLFCRDCGHRLGV